MIPMKRVWISILILITCFFVIPLVGDAVFPELAVASLNDGAASRTMVVQSTLRGTLNYVPAFVFVGCVVWVVSGIEQEENVVDQSGAVAGGDIVGGNKV